MNASNSVSRAFQHAREAQPAWAERSLRERLRVVGNLRHALAARADDVVEAVDAHKSRGPGESLGAEVLPVLEACRFLERRAKGILKPRFPRSYGFFSLFRPFRHEIRREPFGTVLVIGPSNYPFMLPVIQALQALTAGNAAVIKPGVGGEEACRIFADLLAESGLPDGLCHVSGSSTEEAKEALESGPDKVVLTGSAGTGRAVLRELAEQIVPATMELSGCDAVFVLPDADLDLVMKAVRFGLTLNNGATCIAPHRLFATRETIESLEKRLTEADLPTCRVDERVAEYAAELIEEAVDCGARRIAGSAEDAERWKPVILADADPEMPLLQKDVFAPVLSLVRVSDMEDALAAAGRCPYALGATVFGPAGEARSFARRVPAGAVVVNDMVAPTGDPRMPFGGRGESGFGVTRGAEGLLEMTRIKAITVSPRWGKFHLEGASETSRNVIDSYIKAAHGRGFMKRMKAAWHALGTVMGGGGDG